MCVLGNLTDPTFFYHEYSNLILLKFKNVDHVELEVVDCITVVLTSCIRKLALFVKKNLIRKKKIYHLDYSL